MKLFTALGSDLVKLSNVLRDTVKRYNSLIPAIITVTSDVDIVGILATKSKAGPNFPGFDGVYSVKQKINLKAGDKLIGAFRSKESLNNNPRYRDDKPENPYFYFYSPKDDKWGIVYADDYKKLVTNSDIKSSLLTKIKQDKKEERNKKLDQLHIEKAKEFKDLNDKYKNKFNFKYVKPEVNEDFRPYFSFRFDVKGTSFQADFRGPDFSYDLGSYKPDLYLPSPDVKTKEDLAEYTSKLQDFLNNWDTIVAYYSEVKAIKDKYYELSRKA